MIIPAETARQLMVAAQGLDRLPDAPATKADVLATIRAMGVLQIDAIHVIARSPYLVLWSRLSDYRPVWLDELLAEGALFEGWAHAMCFLPIEDFPLYRRRMLDQIVTGKGPAGSVRKWADAHRDVITRVLARMRENGQVRSAEFDEAPRPPGGWWNWKDEKIALEVLLLTGEVMVVERRNFQRSYDLTERVLPAAADMPLPTGEEARREFTLRTVRHLGIASGAWVADYYRQPKTGLPALLESLAAEGQLARARIEGVSGPAYIHPDRLRLLEEVASGARAADQTTFLSPFDPLVWDRQRARDLFGFDYTIEVYTPQAKRQYGYFTLPILRRGALIGRIDPKAHRKTGLFEVKALHLELGVAVDDALIADLATALRRLADWHETPDVAVRWSNRPGLAEAVAARAR